MNAKIAVLLAKAKYHQLMAELTPGLNVSALVSDRESFIVKEMNNALDCIRQAESLSMRSDVYSKH
jgi:hypothetical protein